MPSLDEQVVREPGKPRKISSTITYYPGDEKILENGEMIVGIPDHWNPSFGFYRPDPDKEGALMHVYIESYKRDDSDPAAKKRHSVVVEIP
ncbi:MAG: hypothetical protein ABW250_10280 [Pyrinomonadaceae bacterium]